ncbi:EF hand [Ancylostoma caninum]|uniref:EF hand n=1 Tax=Ancylostoma caninum TaxID=29170 RepID=A0A368H9H1_ANCCA|nr:EF hand [Ancylostoma caninum]
MLFSAVILTRIASLAALPAFVDYGDIPEIELSHPAVNLDLLRYLSDTLSGFFQPEEHSSTTTDPRGMDFAQFVATNRCSGQAAWGCFTDIDTNNDGFVSPAELAEYDKSSMARVEGMYDDYLATSFIEADNDDDGYVSYKEGVDYAENVLKVHADDNWQQLFQAKDFDGDGKLSKKEFMSLVSSWYRGDYNLKFNDYTVTSPKTPQPAVKKT